MLPVGVFFLFFYSFLWAEEFDFCKLENFSKDRLECTSSSPITHNISETVSTVSSVSKNLNLSNEENEKSFKLALKKDVDFLFEAKIYEIRLKKNCANESYNNILSLNSQLDLAKVKEQCAKILQQTKEKIQNDYSQMKINLALSEPRYKENRILRDTNTWYNSQPTHPIRQLAMLAPLSSAEKDHANKEYLSMLDKAGAEVGKKNLSRIIADKSIFNVSYEVVSSFF